MIRSRAKWCFGVLLSSIFASSTHLASNANDAVWPSFLGMGKSEIEVAQNLIPIEWTPDSNVLWQSKLAGYGQSSPVVWGNRVYLTTIDGANKEKQRVICLDLESGKELWRHEQTSRYEGKNSDYIARSAPSPVVDANGVYCFFEVGDVVALDHDGKRLWTKDLVEQYGPIRANHGIGSSLAQSDSLVYIWIQRSENPYAIALAKASGEMVWKIDTPAGVSWSSPVLVPMADGAQHLVLSSSGSAPSRGRGGSDGGAEGTAQVAQPTSGYLLGLDPATGERLWFLDGLSGNSSPTPCVVAPGKLLIGASAGREGGPTKEAIGTNGLVEIRAENGKYSAAYVWRSTKATSGFCSPFHHGGLAYFADRQGILFCLDAQTGEEKFVTRLNQSVWATPVAVADRIYFVGETGKTEVIATGPEVNRLASNELWEADADAAAPPERGGPANEVRDSNGIPQTKPRQYAVVVCKDRLLIRRGDCLYALQQGKL
jgi:outer membrane protein assembly factor BamB